MTKKIIKEKFKPVPKLLAIDSKKSMKILDMSQNLSTTLSQLTWNLDFISLNAQNDEIIFTQNNKMDLLSMSRVIKDLKIQIPKEAKSKIFDPIGQNIYWANKNEIHRISIQSGEKLLIGITNEIIEELILDPKTNKNVYYVTINGNIGVYNVLKRFNEIKIIEKYCGLKGAFGKILTISDNKLGFIQDSELWFYHIKVCTLPLKSLFPLASVWSKSTLNIGSVGGAGAGLQTCKMGTSFLIYVFESTSIFSNSQ